MLKSLNEDIDKLKCRPFPELPSVGHILKLILENDISQLMGTYKMSEPGTRGEWKFEIMAPQIREAILKYRKCGKQKPTNYNMYKGLHFDHKNYFICCEILLDRQSFISV